MKLKHYFHKFQSQIRQSEDELEDLICKSILSKILTCTDSTYPGAAKIVNPSTSIPVFYDYLRDFLPPVSSIPTVFENLRLGPHEYLKYYFLDTLTNHCYVDALINITTFYEHKYDIQFIYNLNLSNFTEGSGSPTIYVEYMKFEGDYYITSIVYDNPFTGDTSLSDFRSMLMDTLFLLNPEKCLQYLTLKLANNVSTISYTNTKEIHLVPLFIDGPDEGSIISRFRHNGINHICPELMEPYIKPINGGLIGEITPIGNKSPTRFNLMYLEEQFN